MRNSSFFVRRASRQTPQSIAPHRVCVEKFTLPYLPYGDLCAAFNSVAQCAVCVVPQAFDSVHGTCGTSPLIEVLKASPEYQRLSWGWRRRSIAGRRVRTKRRRWRRSPSSAIERLLSLRLRAWVRPPSRRLASAIRFLLAFPGTPCCMSDCHCAISGPGVVRLRERGEAGSGGRVLSSASGRGEGTYSTHDSSHLVMIQLLVSAGDIHT